MPTSLTRAGARATPSTLGVDPEDVLHPRVRDLLHGDVVRVGAPTPSVMKQRLRNKLWKLVVLAIASVVLWALQGARQAREGAWARGEGVVEPMAGRFARKGAFGVGAKIVH